MAEDPGTGNAAPAAETNVWNAAIALFVVGGLVAIVIFLVQWYGDDTEKIAAVLGVAAPVLAAAFGVSIGYYSGTKKGEATGKEAGKQEVTSKIVPVVDSLERNLIGGILDPVTRGFESPPDSISYLNPPTQGAVQIEQQSVNASRDAVARLKGIIEGSV